MCLSLGAHQACTVCVYWVRWFSHKILTVKVNDAVWVCFEILVHADEKKKVLKTQFRNSYSLVSCVSMAFISQEKDQLIEPIAP